MMETWQAGLVIMTTTMIMMATAINAMGKAIKLAQHPGRVDM